MSLTPRLDLQLKQRLALTPQLRTRLAVLRMSPLELAEEVAREAARNPFLLHSPPSAPAPSDGMVAEQIAPALGFHEDLRLQLSRQDLPPKTAAAADFLIGELRDDGFLDVTLAELSTELALPLALLEDGLRALQACEPAGIGARSLPECLHLQLRAKGLGEEDATQTLAHLDGFGRRDWPSLRKALSLPLPALKARAALLQSLTPRPVPETAAAPAQHLRADLRLERNSDGTLSILPERRAHPALHLDHAMVARASDDGFAPELLERARALIAALEQRGQTLSRIGDWLALNQARFFAEGPKGLTPCTRSDLAADLQLHPSTISRAVSGKAIDVDGRLWPLSVFFSSAIKGADGPVAAGAVKKRLAELIAGEPAGQPLSDESLVEKLNAEGVDIARRTVAKYRQGLRIPSSAVRRRLAKARRGADTGE
ncbi:RNA polymerase sigma-54 factor [Pararhodobacter oceanensis]|uniref:RNA polymerase factor sigma-54 n=1 Tax=Pararhodobacter oceanensis TaxID=2172121 RepID=UPI003A91E020